MTSSERKLLLIFGIGCLGILGIGILLISIWPYREPIVFLVVALATLQLVVTLALRVIRTLTETAVKLHEQKLRQERLRPNDSGYYEIPLERDKVPMYPTSDTQYQNGQEPYYHGHAHTRSYNGRRD